MRTLALAFLSLATTACALEDTRQGFDVEVTVTGRQERLLQETITFDDNLVVPQDGEVRVRATNTDPLALTVAGHVLEIRDNLTIAVAPQYCPAQGDLEEESVEIALVEGQFLSVQVSCFTCVYGGTPATRCY